jgi:hypothetical protein
MNAAINFEYEWMADGSLRLRFSDDEGIVGQQIIAADGLVALHLLLCLAVHRDADPEAVLAAFQQAGLDVDGGVTDALLESKRVRAGVTPDGGIGIDAIGP